MSADFSRLLDHLHQNLVEHAERDGMNEVRKAIFLARGRHAPGEVCPSAPPAVEDPHEYWCATPESECNCSARGADR